MSSEDNNGERRTRKEHIAREFPEKVGEKEQRKIKGRRTKKEELWFGLGMFGLVGWSVAVPAVIGTAIGYWLDRTYGGQVSWTITLLIVGVCVGGLNAYYWVKRTLGNE